MDEGIIGGVPALICFQLVDQTPNTTTHPWHMCVIVVRIPVRDMGFSGPGTGYDKPTAVALHQGKARQSRDFQGICQVGTAKITVLHGFNGIRSNVQIIHGDAPANLITSITPHASQKYVKETGAFNEINALNT
jgi:hypothetical protein